MTFDSALTPIGNWAWGYCSTVDLSSQRAYIGNGFTFQILDITNFSAPKVIGEYVTSYDIVDIQVKGDSVAYVCNWDSFIILDITEPSRPLKLSETLLWGANRVIVKDSFAYVASGGLVNIIDVSNPNGPVIRSQVAGDGGQGGRDQFAMFNDRYLYLGDPNSQSVLKMYDCQDPDNIQKLPDVNLAWRSFSVSNNNVQLLVGIGRILRVYGLVDPTHPMLLGADTLSFGSEVNAVMACEPSTIYPFDVGFVAVSSEWLYTVDLTNGSHPAVMDSLSFIRAPLSAGVSITINPEGKIGAAAEDGLFLIDAVNPYDLKSGSVFVTGGSGPLEVAVQGSYAYLANDISGLSILDITNPTRPARIGALLFGGAGITRVSIQGLYAYMIGRYGLWIADISDPHNPSFLGWISIGSPFAPPSEIVVRGTRAYVTMGDSAVVILDVSVPGAPTRIGTYPTNAYHLDSRDSLLFLSHLSSMSINDASNPSSISQISSIQLPTTALALRDSLVYIGGYGDTGLTIVSVSDPFHPHAVSSLSVPVGGSSVERIAFSGSYAYLSGSHLNAVDVSNPQSPKLVASYAQVLQTDVASQDRFVYLGEAENGLQIFENRFFHHSQHYSVQAGWNLISVPAFLNGTKRGVLSELFPSARSRAFSFGSAYVACDTIESGRGYWLKFDASQDVQIEDLPSFAETLEVSSGWNMIGSVSIPVSVSDLGSLPANIETSEIFGYNGSVGYQVTDSIRPGSGYWIRTNASAKLILPRVRLSGDAIPSNAIRILPRMQLPPSPPDNLIRQIKTPMGFALDKAFPNPFNPTTTISFTVPEDSYVSLKVYNIAGQDVATLVEGIRSPGNYRFTWNASRFGSGIYNFHLHIIPANQQSKTWDAETRAVLIK